MVAVAAAVAAAKSHVYTPHLHKLRLGSEVLQHPFFPLRPLIE